MGPIAKIDIAKIRAETPGCTEVLHFDNAGASLLPEIVYQSVVEHLKLERSIGGYKAEELAQEKLERFYSAFATLLNCDRREIAYVENATRAWDMAFYSIPFNRGDRILTAQAEYASNYLAFLQITQRSGVKVDVVPNDSTGELSVEALEEMVDERVKLIAITHVPTNGGLVNPVIEVGRITKKYGILYLLDACQSVGQMPVDVEEIGLDILSGTGRKYLRGPRGTGFLYVRKSVLPLLEPPFIDLHAATWVSKDRYELRKDAKRFENWESNVAGRIGLAAAVEYALKIGLSSIKKRVASLAEMLRKELLELPDVVVHDLGKERCGIVSFTKYDLHPRDIQEQLAKKKINVSTSTRYATRLDMESRGLDEVIRASVHYYNTEEEIATFCETLQQLK